MSETKTALDKALEQKDYTAQFTEADVSGNKVMAVVAYLGILVLIPIFAAKDSPYAKFHSNQGLVLVLTGWVVSIALNLLGKLPLIGWLTGILGALVGLVTFVLLIIGIINAVTGKAKNLPIIGSIRLLS